MLDIIFSVALFVFGVYCYFYVGSTSPDPTATELGAAFWPQIILVALCALLAVNIFKSIKGFKDLDESKKKLDIGAFLKSKLFLGMVLVAIMAIIFPIIGFMPTCLLFLIAYGYLLGEKNIGKLTIISLIITIILYIVFQGVLDIMLARGTIGIFREFARTCERILPF